MKRIVSIFLLVLSFAGCIALTGCGGSSSYTAQDLQDAKSRYFNGTASKSDKRMVEGFYKWKANQ